MCSHYTTYLSHHHNTASRRRQSINLSSSLVSMCLVIKCLTVRSLALGFTTKTTTRDPFFPYCCRFDDQLWNVKQPPSKDQNCNKHWKGSWKTYRCFSAHWIAIILEMFKLHKNPWEMTQSYLRWILNWRSTCWMPFWDRCKNQSAKKYQQPLSSFGLQFRTQHLTPKLRTTWSSLFISCHLTCLWVLKLLQPIVKLATGPNQSWKEGNNYHGNWKNYSEVEFWTAHTEKNISQ